LNNPGLEWSEILSEAPSSVDSLILKSFEKSNTVDRKNLLFPRKISYSLKKGLEKKATFFNQKIESIHCLRERPGCFSIYIILQNSGDKIDKILLDMPPPEIITKHDDLGKPTAYYWNNGRYDISLTYLRNPEVKGGKVFQLINIRNIGLEELL
jgi:hypothetical protein